MYRLLLNLIYEKKCDAGEEWKSKKFDGDKKSNEQVLGILQEKRILLKTMESPKVVWRCLDNWYGMPVFLRGNTAENIDGVRGRGSRGNHLDHKRERYRHVASGTQCWSTFKKTAGDHAIDKNVTSSKVIYYYTTTNVFILLTLFLIDLV